MNKTHIGKGSTCMHDKAWHSECKGCNDNSLIDDIFLLVKENPNDLQLGAKIREFYNSYTNDNTEKNEPCSGCHRCNWMTH